MKAILPLAALLAAAPLAAQSAAEGAPGGSAAGTAPAAADTVPRVGLDELVVSAWRFGGRQGPARAQSLSREDWENAPQPGEDVFRMVNRLPGVSANDLSSRFAVRGGSNDELLVRLDGLELVEPFHLREFEGGGLSIVDMEALGGVDLVSGGAPAEYGDRLTGVFDMRTTQAPADGHRTVLGLSLTNARALAQHAFAGGRGEWMLSARRGYLDLVLDMVEENEPQGNTMIPRYGDVMGKVQYQLGASHLVSVHGLYASDSFRARDGDLTARTGYGNAYAWANWRARFGRVSAHTVASAGDLDWSRGGEWEGARTGSSVRDERTLRFAGVRQDWRWEGSDRFVAKAGWEWKTQDAAYDYTSLRRERVLVDGAVVDRVDSVRVLADPAGTEAAAYAAGQLRPFEGFVVEAGVRYDRQEHTGDEGWSPRLNLAWAVGGGTTVRGAWGVHRQSQPIHAMQVQNGARDFFGAELAEHRVLGVEHTGGGVRVRAEAYQRLLRDPRPRYVNLDRTIDIFPEVEDDRVRVVPESGEARGVELFAERVGEGRVHWWASYALARVEDRFSDGLVLPREVDQRHTAHLGLSYVPSPRWRVSAAWEYHSGLPITGRTWESGVLADGTPWVRSRFGDPYGERLPAYHRMDARVSRTWDTRRGRVSAFLDVFNLYNRDNARAYSYSYQTHATGVNVQRTVEKLLPVLPSIGVSWEF